MFSKKGVGGGGALDSAMDAVIHGFGEEEENLFLEADQCVEHQGLLDQAMGE